MSGGASGPGRTEPLAIAVGDPAGVGPAVAAEAVARALGSDRALLFGDGARLIDALDALGVRAMRFEPDGAFRLGPGGVAVVDVAEWSDADIAARAPTPGGGRAQLAQLDAAIDAVLAGRARALVTGPTSKEAVTLGGTPFVGQTEHLARRSGLADDDVTMMFLGPRLRVALVTTHLSVRAAPEAITAPRVEIGRAHV